MESAHITTIATFRSKRDRQFPPEKGVMPNFDAAIPSLDGERFPIHELVWVSRLRHVIRMLNYYVRCFEADVQLYEIAAEDRWIAASRLTKDPTDVDADATLEILDGWPQIAARDGAMSIYHFGRSLNAIDTTLAKAPELRRAIDVKLKRVATKRFDASFPHFAKIRHAVAHSAERIFVERHAHDGEWRNAQMSFGPRIRKDLVDVLYSRQYSNTWQGMVVSYDIGIGTLERLASIRDNIFEAVTPATKGPPVIVAGSDP